MIALPMFWLACSFVMGLVSAVGWRHGTPLTYYVCSAVVLLLVGCCWQKKRLALTSCLAMLGCGILAAPSTEPMLSYRAPCLRAESGENHWWQVEVLGGHKKRDPRRKGHGVRRVEVRTHAVLCGNKWWPEPGRLGFYLRSDTPVRAHDILQLKFKLKPWLAPLNPGEADFRQYAALHGYKSQALQRSEPLWLEFGNGFFSQIDVWREAVAVFLEKRLAV
ncbi:MAG TPA: DUF4131 domain-containing protein, partial [Chromatiaceae bacterium]|nr:DUF4131 domain-containing protein [Chromatiaceae bacterium]